MVQHIGLTGGIGSGKSTVSALFAQFGAKVIDADEISRSLTAKNGLAIPAIRQQFGAKAIDETLALNRTYMRELIFKDPVARQQLENILHPLITKETQQQAALAQEEGTPIIIFDIPLLVESLYWRQKVDAVIVVDCEEETQIQRVIARNHLDRSTVVGIMQAQATRAQRKAVADWVIYNDGLNFAQLRQQVLSVSTLLQL